MTDRYSIAHARRNLSALVREAENGKALELTRRGEAVAVIVGRRQFARLTTDRRGFVEAYRDFMRGAALAELAFDPDELFGSARDKAPGRDVRL